MKDSSKVSIKRNVKPKKINRDEALRLMDLNRSLSFALNSDDKNDLFKGLKIVDTAILNHSNINQVQVTRWTDQLIIILNYESKKVNEIILPLLTTIYNILNCNYQESKYKFAESKLLVSYLFNSDDVLHISFEIGELISYKFPIQFISSGYVEKILSSNRFDLDKLGFIFYNLIDHNCLGRNKILSENFSKILTSLYQSPIDLTDFSLKIIHQIGKEISENNKYSIISLDLLRSLFSRSKNFLVIKILSLVILRHPILSCDDTVLQVYNSNLQLLSIFIGGDCVDSQVAKHAVSIIHHMLMNKKISSSEVIHCNLFERLLDFTQHYDDSEVSLVEINEIFHSLVTYYTVNNNAKNRNSFVKFGGISFTLKSIKNEKSANICLETLNLVCGQKGKKIKLSMDDASYIKFLLRNKNKVIRQISALIKEIFVN